MAKTKVYIENVIISRWYDCIEVILNDCKTQIVFDKSSSVIKYKYKEVYLYKNAGEDFSIEEIIGDVE